MIKRMEIKKIITVLLALVILFVVQYYIRFESIHYFHECSGADCPICYELHVAEVILNQLGAVVLTVIYSFFLIAIIRKVAVLFICSFQERTLILDKVRLDD
ncbi:MAG: hypothetical protein PHX08_17350 [Lachnospiraceae bacterium]|nr:hypothetical protein [Lachnospiraceae bacterium]